jgi:hypothetical protein
VVSSGGKSDTRIQPPGFAVKALLLQLVRLVGPLLLVKALLLQPVRLVPWPFLLEHYHAGKVIGLPGKGGYMMVWQRGWGYRYTHKVYQVEWKIMILYQIWGYPIYKKDVKNGLPPKKRLSFTYNGLEQHC